MEYAALREECLEANLLLPSTGLVDLTFGNVSVADRDGGFLAIKPSGVDYQKLTPSDIVVLDFEGQVVAGTFRPSSDTPTHLRLIRAFEGIRSVVHTHSRSAVAFAQAGREIPCLGTTHADYFYGSVPVTRIMTPEEVSRAYELETANVIIERFSGLDPLAIRAVLVQGHGPFTWSTSALHAVEVAQALEIVADMALKTLSLAPTAPGLPRHVLDKHYLRKHGPTAYYGQK
ncbi:MAG TPA: L-ribulose-5-phosphate 4-epimerase AraD [Chthoniobacterales bacterium]|jgi:L-ribulose-5-phosphate 4-epimerase